MSSLPGAAKLTFASYLSPALWPLYRSIGGYLERRLHRRVRMLTGSSFAQFGSGEVDLGFI
ncbi:MAG: hypothetical protein M1274_07930 [Actinobacteria bacterium]|nr:hypothetical protein [Actinomycetota bacterium]